MRLRSIFVWLPLCLLAGCSTMSSKQESIPTVASFELPRFMGDWYVIAAIPLSAEKNAYNAVESYKLLDDGTVHTDFRMRDGGFDKKLKTYTPHAYPDKNAGNALWGMRLAWYLPFKAEYRIAFLETDYSATIIARNKRDYVWLMARQPTIKDADYTRYVAMISKMGYDTSKLRRVPQRWPETEKE